MYQKFMLSSWHNSLLYASEDSISSVSPGEKGCHCIHMRVTILLAAAVTVVGRSLSFGLSASLGWFTADTLFRLHLLDARFPHHSQRLLVEYLGLSAWAEPQCNADCAHTGS